MFIPQISDLPASVCKKFSWIMWVSLQFVCLFVAIIWWTKRHEPNWNISTEYWHMYVVSLPSDHVTLGVIAVQCVVRRESAINFRHWAEKVSPECHFWCPVMCYRSSVSHYCHFSRPTPAVRGRLPSRQDGVRQKWGHFRRPADHLEKKTNRRDTSGQLLHPLPRTACPCRMF